MHVSRYLDVIGTTGGKATVETVRPPVPEREPLMSDETRRHFDDLLAAITREVEERAAQPPIADDLRDMRTTLAKIIHDITANNAAIQAQTAEIHALGERLNDGNYPLLTVDDLAGMDGNIELLDGELYCGGRKLGHGWLARKVLGLPV